MRNRRHTDKKELLELKKYIILNEKVTGWTGEGNGNPLQYSCLENPRDGGAWWAAVHGVAQSRTWLKRLSMHALQKEMATHSSILAWRIPGMEKPGGLPCMGSHRVRYDWSDLAAAAAPDEQKIRQCMKKIN